DEGAERDDIGYLRTQRIKITTDPPQKVVLDGEIIGETPIEVECISRQLTVIVPDHLSSEPAEKLEGLPGLKVKSKTDPSLNDEESEEENSDVDVLVVDYRLLDELSFAEEQ
ncbi:MAG: lipid kinase, partial [Cyanobacteriota bacterium]|nr:lipid kinase [Cyanobacteriota bacterium]